MTQYEYLKTMRKAADVNLQLLETLLELNHDGQLTISAELSEMIEYTLEINWQQYRLITEKIRQIYGDVL